MALAVGVAVVALLLWPEEDPPTKEQIAAEDSSSSEAFCLDLDAGLSLHQLYRNSGMDSVPAFMRLASELIRESCPEWLEDEGIQGILDAWGVSTP